MHWSAITEFVEEWNVYLRERSAISDRESIYARTVKLMEEMGELSSEILSSQGEQRKEKLDRSNPEDLEREFADVFLSLLLLAKSYDLDILEAATEKIEKIRARHKASSTP